jgi:hypothetical protein
MNSIGYQLDCLSRPVVTSITLGSIFTGISVMQGARFTPRLAAINIGGLYCYNILQCPMEAIHGRHSAWHNALSGAILGYVGVSRRMLGIPFVDPYFFYRYPQLSPPVVGATVYGGLSLALVTVLGGKSF